MDKKMKPETPGKMAKPTVVRHHHRHNLRNRFQLVKTLGQGTYGKVKLAVERSTGTKVRSANVANDLSYSLSDPV